MAWLSRVINKPSPWKLSTAACALEKGKNVIDKQQIRRKTLFSMLFLCWIALEAKKRWNIYGRQKREEKTFSDHFLVFHKNLFYVLFASSFEHHRKKCFFIFAEQKRRPQPPHHHRRIFHELRECVEMGWCWCRDRKPSDKFFFPFLLSYIFISMITTSITVNVVKSSSFTPWSVFRKVFCRKKNFSQCLCLGRVKGKEKVDICH